MIWFRFLGSEHRAAQRALTDFNARVVSQVNRLAIKRGMIKTLVDNGFNNKTGCEHSFFNNGCRRWRSAHSGFLATGARTFLPLGELHERFDGFDGEAFAASVADGLSVPAALGQVHSRVGRAMIVPDGADFLAEERAPLWRKTFCVSHQGGTVVSFGALADSCASNAIERINQELKRRTRVARVFPNEHSLLRLITALLCETSEEW